MPDKCAAAPCKSCPYRRDVPSGVWAAEEYIKLPAFAAQASRDLWEANRAAYTHNSAGAPAEVIS